MNRIASRLLILLPALLVAATVGVWAWQTFGTKRVGPAPPQAEVRTHTVGGITFEAEYQVALGEYGLTTGADSIGIRRGTELLDYEDDALFVNGVGYPALKPGDTVRWNRDGAVLVNGTPREPHPHQPRPLEMPGTDLRWELKSAAQSGRDTLSVDWSRSGRVLVSASGDGGVRVWDVDRREVRLTILHEPPKAGGFGAWGVRAAISPDGQTIASANPYAADVILWDAASGKKLATLSGPPGNVRAVRFLTDGWLLEARGESLLARQLIGDRAKTVDLGKIHDHFPPPFALSGDGKTLVVNDGTKVTVSRVTIGPAGVALSLTGAVVEKLSGDSVVALSHDGSLLAVFDGDTRLTVHDAATGARKHRLRWRGDGRAMQIGAMGFFPDGKTLAVGDVSSLRLYDLDSGRERGGIATPWVRSLAISVDGRTLAAGLRYTPGVRVWDIAALHEGK